MQQRFGAGNSFLQCADRTQFGVGPAIRRRKLRSGNSNDMLAGGHGSGAPAGLQERVLREVARVLRPSGRLYLGADNRLSAGCLPGDRQPTAFLVWRRFCPRGWLLVYPLHGTRVYRNYLYPSAGIASFSRKQDSVAARFFVAFPSHNICPFSWCPGGTNCTRTIAELQRGRSAGSERPHMSFC